LNALLLCDDVVFYRDKQSMVKLRDCKGQCLAFAARMADIFDELFLRVKYIEEYSY